MPSAALWAGIGSALGVIFTLISTVLGRERITLWMNNITAFLSPYFQITIPEYAAGRMERSDLYAAIEAYLYERRGTEVHKLTAELGRHTKTTTPLFYVDDGQQIIDTYAPGDGDGVGNEGSGDSGNEGSGGGDGGNDEESGGGDSKRSGGSRATIWWYAYSYPVANVAYSRPGQEERRFYRVSFHRRFRKLIREDYLPHVIKQGRDLIAGKRQRRLFTNTPNSSSWTYAAFQHPAELDKLAMEPTLRQSIKDDLDAFKNREEYYHKLGKPWKRGYLLYGPPGTGKSTLVSAMANYLKYDVYDLELTAVESNSALRMLFIETTGKSIIVIEDIDRSVDLTDMNRQRTSTKEEDTDNGRIQQLTLSGLLNFIDGLWSACGGERIIVFTTNNRDKLDPALIRPGRMDKEIEMSYCTFEGFRVLAENYLGIMNEHNFFQRYGEIQHLLGKAEMTPANVAEHLMRKENDNGAILDGLIRTLKKAVAEKEKAVAEASKEQGGRDQEE